MSSADLATVGGARPRYRGAFRRLFGGELRLILTRRRNIALLVVLAVKTKQAAP